jgi:mRNA interferase HigB
LKVIGTDVLHEFGVEHADVRGQIAAWLAEVEDGEWKTPLDVRARYPSVSFVGDNIAVFDLKGNKYRLEVRIAFNLGVVSVSRMGTHAEYTKWVY